MLIENIRLSKQGRDQLITLKRHTGIEHWNVLCRWAFCMSVADMSKPRERKIPADSSVEMSWRTFAGDNDLVYTALLRERCKQDEIELTDVNLVQQFRLHLHRGIASLAGDPQVKSIAGLVRKATTPTLSDRE